MTTTCIMTVLVFMKHRNISHLLKRVYCNLRRHVRMIYAIKICWKLCDFAFYVFLLLFCNSYFASPGYEVQHDIRHQRPCVWLTGCDVWHYWFTCQESAVIWTSTCRYLLVMWKAITWHTRSYHSDIHFWYHCTVLQATRLS